MASGSQPGLALGYSVSKALVEAAGDAPLLPVEDFAALPGQGVAGRMDGQLWHLGNHRMVEDLGRCSEALEARIFPLEEAGKIVEVGDIEDRKSTRLNSSH